MATNCLVGHALYGKDAMNYNTISAQRIAGALGAEIAGVDLSRPLSDLSLIHISEPTRPY